ncbi:TRAP transporter small permease [Martelella mangrovi]|uniref:TRAP transporter small permease protein n=1 Tax=Martelella mangrovi TaxID=1397477 RepID=A0ABV2IDS8_9HYPH
MHTLRRILDAVVGTACCIVLAAMVAVLAWQVFSRYALNAPSTFSEEFLRFGVIWMSLLGAAYSAGKGTHMAIDLVPEMTSGRLRMILKALVPISFMIFAVLVLIIGGMRGVNIAVGQHSPVLRVPMGLVYASLPVSGGFILVYSILNLVEILFGKRDFPDQVEKIAATGD